MKLTTLLPVAVLVATLAIPRTAHAHFIWATIEGGQVRFALLENPSEAPNPQFAKYVEALKTPLILGATVEGARSCALPTGKTTAYAESIIGAKKREETSYLLVYHAKGAASLADAATTGGACVELLATREGEKLTVTALHGGKPAPQAAVTLHLPGVEETQSATTDTKGIAHFTLPQSLTPGFIGVRANVIETKSGEYQGAAYTEVHHWATLAVPSGSGKPRNTSVLVLALDADGDGKLSAQEISVSGKTILTLDRDGDGKITNPEFHQARAQRPQESQAAALLEFDKNHDGKLTRDELPERLQGIFSRVTPDAQGAISKEALEAFAAKQQQAVTRQREASQPAPDPNAPKPTVEVHGKDTYVVLPGPQGLVRRLSRLLTALDTDGDQILSTDEIAQAPKSLLKLDENGDSTLDSEELAAAVKTEFISLKELETIRQGRQ